MSDQADRTLDDLMPPIMATAWLGSIHYAISRPDIVRAFRAETGIAWEPGDTPVDRLVDEASGAGLEFVRAFAKWHNQNIWGEKDGRPVDVGDFEQESKEEP